MTVTRSPTLGDAIALRHVDLAVLLAEPDDLRLGQLDHAAEAASRARGRSGPA